MALTLEEYERLNPRSTVEHGGVAMTFATPTTFTRWRVDTIYEKEPWTLEWIAGFAAGDILFDVGANVGMYTVWAAATRGARVYAFEPEAQNYALLNRNIALNDLGERVTAYCLGLSDQDGLVDLFMHDLRAGGSNHALGEALDFKHQPMTPRFRQGGIAARLDRLVQEQALPVPAHIKLDIDGFEPRVIEGARATLANRGVRSLLIETNPALDAYRAMIASLEGLGFRYDPAQVARATRKEGPFTGIAEYVFTR